MWKLHFCVFLSIVYLCAGDDGCSSTLATTACESPKDQPTPRQNQPPPNTTPPPPIEDTPAPAPPPPPKQSPLAPPKDQPLSPKNPTGNSCPTEDEQNTICNKAKESQFKNNPFCQNAGEADEGCKQLTEAITGANPKCYQPDVCSFKTKDGTPVYVCSKDMQGVTLFKGCNNDISIISKPDKSPLAPPKDQPLSPKNPTGNNCPTEDEQNTICNKAKESQFENNPFCQNTGEADEGCKQLTQAITGANNPKCYQPDVCSFTTKGGTTAYVCSKDMPGVTLYKGCNNDISIISKPDKNSKPSPGPGPENGTKKSGSLPSNTPTDHEQNLICVKASEDEYKEPFCQNTGGADEACKKISDSINGSNPSCCNQYVCQFTSSAGATVYVSSQDIPGATVYKGCHHNVKIISKPDGGWPAPSPRSGTTENNTKPSGSPPSNTPTDHEQNLICVKASEDEYKEPFCQNTGGADEACKKISDSINGSNPSCCNQYVCQFTSSAGATVYVSSQDIAGATVYKGCHHNVKIISKPDGGWPAPSPRSGPTENDTKPSGSPPSNTPTDHEQNLICVKASEDEYKEPFCQNTGGADEACKKISDSINGINPSCCTQYVCQITSPEGTLVYVACKDIQGVHEIKGCHNNVRIISKPDGDLGNNNNASSSPPQSLNTPPSNNQPPATDPPKSTPHIGSPTKEPEESCSTTEPTTPPSTPTATALPAC